MTEKVIDRVGGSIGSAGNASVTSGAQIVSATVVSASPATAMMSPALASSVGAALDAAIGQQLGQPRLLDGLPVAAQRLDRHVEPRDAGMDAPGQNAARETGRSPSVVASIANGASASAPSEPRRGGGTCATISSNSGARSRRGSARSATAQPSRPGGEQRRKIELLLAGVEQGEQVEDLVVHLGGARVRAIDLVDDDDRLQAARQRLADDELGLRHRPLGGIDQHQDAVHHAQDALDLAAEIGVARRIDDVDAHVPSGLHRGAFGEDRDAAFALQIVRIERALGDLLVGAERAALAQQLIDQRRLAVIDMRDDRDVADFHTNL